eukprot:scaffold488277_cov23-Prasinocladus_malaysianus.AAC.1
MEGLLHFYTLPRLMGQFFAVMKARIYCYHSQACQPWSPYSPASRAILLNLNKTPQKCPTSSPGLPLATAASLLGICINKADYMLHRFITTPFDQMGFNAGARACLGGDRLTHLHHLGQVIYYTACLRFWSGIHVMANANFN